MSYHSTDDFCIAQVVDAINKGINLAVLQDMAPFAMSIYRDRIFAALECAKLKARTDSYVEVHKKKSCANCCSTPTLCNYPNTFKPNLIDSKYCCIAKPELKVEIPEIKVEVFEPVQTKSTEISMQPPPPFPPKLKRQRKQYTGEVSTPSVTVDVTETTPSVEIVDLCNDTECMST